MMQETKNTLLQIFAYVTITLVLVVTIIGFQQTEYKKAEFTLLDQEVTAFTDQVEEELPALKIARENTQAFVDNITEAA